MSDLSDRPQLSRPNPPQSPQPRLKRPADHQHGGDPARELRRYGLEPREIIDFSANLSPLGPPPAIRQLWPDLWQQVESYPSLHGSGVRFFYQQRFNLDAEQVLPGNGATELIYLIPRVMGWQRAAVLRPAYADYQRACEAASVEVLPFDLSPDHDFSWPEQSRWQRLAEQVDVFFIGQPNNPTGNLFNADHIRSLAAAFPRVWWVVDESFIQLTDHFPEQSLAFAGRLPRNILVVHSLTKTYALAGLRLGAAIGTAETIARLARFKEPWSVNGVADRVAKQLVNCRPYEEELRELLTAQRRILAQGLRDLGLKVFEPSANFLLARLSGGGLDQLLRSMLVEGFCLRDCRNFPGLENGYFRLAVRTEEENRSLLAALARCLTA